MEQPTTKVTALTTVTEVNTAIEKFVKEGANLLFPKTRIEALSKWHQPVLDTVDLDPDQSNGDVWLHEKSQGDKPGKYALHAQGYNKLAVCACIEWELNMCGVVEHSREYVNAQAVGGIRLADGSMVWKKAMYDIDMEVIESEIDEQYEKKRKAYLDKPDKNSWFAKKMNKEKQDEYIASCIRRDVLQVRKHMLKRAETGANCRVIKALLGLKAAYTTKELRKPFVIPRFVFRPDYEDPAFKTKMIDASVQAMTGIYGTQKNTSGNFPEVKLDPNNIIEVGEDDFKTAPNVSDNDEIPEDDIPQDEIQDEDSQMVDFDNADADSQIKTLETLAKRKEYDLAKFDLSTFDENNRKRFYNHLIEMPDPQGELKF